MSIEEKVYAQCVEEGDCMIWKGRVTEKGGMPEIHVAGKGNRHIRPILYRHWHGKIPEGKVISPICGNKMCLCRQHLQAITKAKACQIAARRGAYSNAAKIMKSVLTNRAKSWITDELIEKIMDAKSGAEASRITGVSHSHCKNIRNGTARIEFVNNPFAGLMASNDSARRAA